MFALNGSTALRRHRHQSQSQYAFSVYDYRPILREGPKLASINLRPQVHRISPLCSNETTIRLLILRPQ